MAVGYGPQGPKGSAPRARTLLRVGPYQNLWDAAKAILTGTFIMIKPYIVIKAYIEKKEISQVNNLNQLKMDEILKHQICNCQPTRR